MVLNYIYRLIRNISLELPPLDKIFFKLDYLRAPNKELFSTLHRDIERSIVYSHNIFMSTFKLIKKFDANYTLENKTILEIGPGDNFLLAYIFLLNGAKEVYLIDRLKTNINDSYNFKFYKHYIQNYYKREQKIDLKDFFCLNSKIKYFSYTPFECLSKIKKNSVDLIFSQAVLEHITDLKTAIQKNNLFLKEGGYTIHQVDLRDHLHFNDNCYLDFLKYRCRFWKFFGEMTNRARFSQYINYFNNYNLEILDILDIKRVGPYTKINKIKKRFLEVYRNLSDEDLSIISFKIIAKKG